MKLNLSWSYSKSSRSYSKYPVGHKIKPLLILPATLLHEHINLEKIEMEGKAGPFSEN